MSASGWSIVTGVLGGIGLATAAEFRRQGWYVIGTDRRGLGEATPPADECSCRPTSASRARSARSVDDRRQRLDALVNNAAFQANFAVAETPDETFDDVLTHQPARPVQADPRARPSLAEARGGIVNVSSVHAVATSANVAAYAMSKGALVVADPIDGDRPRPARRAVQRGAARVPCARRC